MGVFQIIGRQGQLDRTGVEVQGGAALDFGRVRAGTSATKTFALVNLQNSELVGVTATWVHGRPFEVTVPPASPFTIDPNGQVSVTITFSPALDAAGQTFMDAVVFGDGTGQNFFGITVRGTAVE